MIHRYTIRRDKKSEWKSMIDYLTLNEKLRKDVLEVKIVKAIFDGSHHYPVLVKTEKEEQKEYDHGKVSEEIVSGSWIG